MMLFLFLSLGFKGLNGINQLIFVVVKCGVLFEVRTGFLNVICASFGFKYKHRESCTPKEETLDYY
jgi:hypothetical protein